MYAYISRSTHIYRFAGHPRTSKRLNKTPKERPRIIWNRMPIYSDAFTEIGFLTVVPLRNVYCDLLIFLLN